MNIFTTVTRVRFAHDDKSRLACSSSDNQLSICQVIPEPATVIAVLQGHTGGVTGIWPYKPFILKNATRELSKIGTLAFGPVVLNWYLILLDGLFSTDGSEISLHTKLSLILRFELS